MTHETDGNKGLAYRMLVDQAVHDVVALAHTLRQALAVARMAHDAAAVAECEEAIGEAGRTLERLHAMREAGVVEGRASLPASEVP